MNVHEFAELSAGRALRALSPVEERAFLEALIAHPEWQAIADADLETAAALADGAAPVDPPAEVRAQLMERIGIRPATRAEAKDADTAAAASSPSPEQDSWDAQAGDPAVALQPTVEPPFVPLPTPEAPLAPQPASPDLAAAEPIADRIDEPTDEQPFAPRPATRSSLSDGSEDGAVAPAELGAPVDPSASVEAAAPGEPAARVEPPAKPTVSAEEAALRAAAPPTEVIQAIQRRNWTRGVFALVASIAVLVGVGWGVGAITDVVRTPPAVKTLALIESADDAHTASAEIGEAGSATLHWSETVGEAVLVASGLPEVGDDRTFELWFVRGDEAVSAGTFDAADGQATAQLAGDLQDGDAVAITVEQRGGSPEGVPTTDPIVAIEAAEPAEE